MDCMILGDSIAVGMHSFRPECVAYAKGGLNSWQWNNAYITKDLAADTVIISLGTNDHSGIKTRRELATMRQLIKAKQVYWVLPHDNSYPKGAVHISLIQKIVTDIAYAKGDKVITTTHYQRDNIHPSHAGYRELITQTK